MKTNDPWFRALASPLAACSRVMNGVGVGGGGFCLFAFCFIVVVMFSFLFVQSFPSDLAPLYEERWNGGGVWFWFCFFFLGVSDNKKK